MSTPSRLRRWSLKIFTIVGALTCGIFALASISMAVRCAMKDRVPDGVVLELRLEGALSEGGADPLSVLLGRRKMTVRDAVEALEKAQGDDRVVGVIAHVGAAEQGLARTQEIRNAILRFRESGKFAVAFAETFGELSPGNQGYYLATAFDEIWLQPTGSLGLNGLVSEAMFVKGTLEKLDVEAEGDHRREYKNAYNMFTERRYTDAHHEAAKTILDDMFSQLVRDIAERRGKSEEEIRQTIDRGPFLAAEALEAGLVDGLAYRDEVIQKLEERAGGEPELLYLEKYLGRAGRPHRRGPKVALIHGVGAVVRGKSGFDPLSGQTSMGSDTVAGAFRAAMEDEDVKAILFRVDSPGGSAVASDTIWREVVRAREAGKPVVVSMGNVAGSGGYYVACGASKIVAHPGTITGSIGVLGGKPVTRGLWNKLGVTWDEVHSSENATFFSSLHRYDGDDWSRLEAWLDRVYADFKEKVADGRGMTAEQVEAVAKGRIWSGERAKELGLVDELGGYATALRLAKEEAGIEADAQVELALFPPPKGVLDRLLGEGPESSEDQAYADASSRISATVDRMHSFVRALESAGLTLKSPDVLSMPPVSVGP